MGATAIPNGPLPLTALPSVMTPAAPIYSWSRRREAASS